MFYASSIQFLATVRASHLHPFLEYLSGREGHAPPGMNIICTWNLRASFLGGLTGTILLGDIYLYLVPPQKSIIFDFVIII